MTVEVEAGPAGSIAVAGVDLNFREIALNDLTPMGTQIAEVAGIRPANTAVILHILAGGDLEDIRPDEVVDLRRGTRRFIVVQSDRSYRFTVEEQRLEWAHRVISGTALRKLGRVSGDMALFLERANEPDRLIGDHDLIDLGAPGVESFRIRKPSWKLNVQGVLLDFAAPSVVVRSAVTEAGLDVDAPWHIFLKVAGQPKRPVGLDDVIDLTTPGIEKLRLTPKDVNNGEAPIAPRRDFALLDADHTHLNRLGLRWETIVDGGRRWLLLHHYPVPGAYTVKTTLLALEIPPAYPGAQIYGFYAFPPLALTNGREIPNTQMRGSIGGREFHGWSRRTSTGWNAARDNVITQLALVEAALAKEAGE